MRFLPFTFFKKISKFMLKKLVMSFFFHIFAFVNLQKNEYRFMQQTCRQ